MARFTQSSCEASVQPGGSMESTSPVVSGAFLTQGPLGITWWVCTSKTNSVPFRACWQAAVSVGGGAVNRPPRGRGWEVAPGCDADAQPASSKAARDAATAPAPCRNRRRSTPNRRAASSMFARMSSLTLRSRPLPGAGTNSPLDTGPAASGR